MLIRGCLANGQGVVNVAVLKVVEGGNPGQILDLHGERLVVGRHPSCHIVLDNSAVSRNHAQILESHGNYFIEDLRSRNGTLVNGEAIQTRTLLKDADLVGICDVVFSFHVQHPDQSRKLERTQASPTPGASPSPGVNSSINMRPPAPPPPTVEIEHEELSYADQSSIVSSVNVGSLSELRLEVKPEVKLRAILDITTTLGKTLQVDKLLPKIIDSLLRIFPGADRGLVLLKSGKGDEVQIKSIRYRSDERQTSAPVSMTIINHALRTKQAFLSEDAVGDDRFNASESVANLRIRSVMCAPLITPNGMTLGAIQVDTLDSRLRFAQDDLDLIVAIAAQAAMAIDNAHLHEDALQRRDLERDLEFASQVQLGFLPTDRPLIPGYHFYDYYEAAHRVGGDFFDYITLPDGRLAVTLGDVAGKGVPAALLMARMYSMARYALVTAKTPAQAVSQLNASIASSGLGHRFITFVLIVLDPATEELTIVNAGHLPPILRTNQGIFDAIAGEKSGLPLGVTLDFQYQQATIPFAPGNGLLLYTDGVTEAMNAANQIYGTPRLRQFLSGVQGSVEHIGEALVADVEEFCAGRPQRDDICLVYFRRQA